MDIYYQSVGRGACLNLNLPLDKTGRIPAMDLESLQSMGRLLRATFATDLASAGKARANNVRGGDAQFAEDKLLDSKPETYWATDDRFEVPEVLLEFDQPITFNVVRIREYLPLGQRVESFAVDAWSNDTWLLLQQGSSIGNQRLIRSRPVTTQKVRLRIPRSAACPAISELSLFLEPEELLHRSLR